MGEVPAGIKNVSAFVGRAVQAVREAEEANRKANSEAGYAYNAKQAAEEHARAISALKGQAEADVGWFTATRQGVEQAQATISQIRAEAESAKLAVSEVVAEVEKGRASVRASSEQADAFQAQAEKASGDAASHSKSAATNATDAAGFSETAFKAADKVEKLLEQVIELARKAGELAATVDEQAAAVSKAYDAASALVNSMSASDRNAAQVLSVIQKHEGDLARLKDDFSKLHARIESVLPYATSAGLATAFREQKARFEKPQWMWLGTFVVTIGGLFAFSLWGLPASDSWDSIGRHFIKRLPLIAPLVWLAIYAGRHHGLALRLQEEYAYKEAVSAAFEGYKREMSTVGSASDGRSPLVTLCENVLRTLGQRPGRIYEGKHEDITPANSVVSAAKEVATAAKDVVQAAIAGAKV